MLFKISYRNLRRSIRDYALYFLTLTLSVALFYMFRTSTSQEAFSRLSSSIFWLMSGMTDIMKIVSRFLVAVFGFLILYANRFMVRRRRREIGMYMVLGMKPRQLAKMLVLEILLLNVLALGLGLVIGTLGSQGLSLLVMRAFLLEMSQFRFVFSAQALLATVLSYLAISLLVMLLIVIQLSRLKLIDLIRPGRRIRHPGKLYAVFSLLGFLIASVILGIAYSMIINIDLESPRIPREFSTAIILGVVGTYLLLASLTGFILQLTKIFKNIYYRRLNYFTLRQIAARMSTFWLSLATTTLLLFFTLSFLSVSFFFVRTANRILAPYSTENKYDIESWVFYDLNSRNDAPQELTRAEILTLSSSLDKEFRQQYQELIVARHGDAKYRITDSTLVRYYVLDEDKIGLNSTQGPVLTENWSSWQDLRSSDSDNFLLLSAGEARKLLQYHGLEPEWSEEETVLLGHPLISTAADVAARIDEDNLSLLYEDNNNQLKFVFDLVSANEKYWPLLGMTGRLLVIVPDATSSQLSLANPGYRVGLFREDEAATDNYRMATENLMSDLRVAANRNFAFDYDCGYARFIDSKVELESNAGVRVIFSFVGLYICLTFILITVTILALQHLSEVSDNRQRYRVLSQIGAQRKYLSLQIIIEAALYFYLPLALAIFHSIFAFRFIARLVKLVGLTGYPDSVRQTLLFAILIYSIYYILTAFSAVRLALPAIEKSKKHN